MSRLSKIGTVAAAVIVTAAVAVGVVQMVTTSMTTYTGPTTITSCQTIDHKIVNSEIDVRVTNGDAESFGRNEAAAKAASCVIFTNDQFNVAGGTALAISTSYSTSTACKLSGVARPCGPVFVADSSVTEQGTPTGIVNLINETNFHIYRTPITGGDQGANCDGYCDVIDSHMSATKLDTSGNAHMDGFSSNGNNGRPIVLDGDTFACDVTNSHPAGNGGCSGDIGFFGDFGQVSNVIVNGNTLIGSDGPAYCAYTGASQNPVKAFPTGKNLTWTNNTFQHGPTGKCATYGPVADWGAGNGNVACGNRWEDGSAISAIPDTAGCASPTTTTTMSVPPTTFPPPPPTTTSTTSTTTVPVTTTTRPSPTTTTTQPAPTTTTTTVPAPPVTFKVTMTCTFDEKTHALVGCT